MIERAAHHNHRKILNELDATGIHCSRAAVIRHKVAERHVILSSHVHGTATSRAVSTAAVYDEPLPDAYTARETGFQNHESLTGPLFPETQGLGDARYGREQVAAYGGLRDEIVRARFERRLTVAVCVEESQHDYAR